MEDRLKGNLITTMMYFFAGAVAVYDMAVNDEFTYTPLIAVSVLFLWLVIAPVFYFKKLRLTFAMISFCVFIVPLFYVISEITSIKELFFPLGLFVSGASMIYIWVLYFFINQMKVRPWNAAGVGIFMLIIFAWPLTYALELFGITENLNALDAFIFFGVLLTTLVFLIIGAVTKRED